MDADLNIAGPDASNSTDEARVPELVTRSLAGEEAAFGELVQLYHGRVFGLVYRIVRQADDAREVEQTTWVKAWQRLGTYRKEARFFTWLYRIAVNTAMDHVRKQIRQREVPLEREDGRDPVPAPEWAGSLQTRPDAAAGQDEVRVAFAAALEGLSAEHRAALVLREVEGRTYQEIAKMQGCRVGTVMSRLFYARRAIQDKMRSVR